MNIPPPKSVERVRFFLAKMCNSHIPEHATIKDSGSGGVIQYSGLFASYYWDPEGNPFFTFVGQCSDYWNKVAFTRYRQVSNELKGLDSRGVGHAGAGDPIFDPADLLAMVADKGADDSPEINPRTLANEA